VTDLLEPNFNFIYYHIVDLYYYRMYYFFFIHFKRLPYANPIIFVLDVFLFYFVCNFLQSLLFSCYEPLAVGSMFYFCSILFCLISYIFLFCNFFFCIISNCYYHQHFSNLVQIVRRACLPRDRMLNINCVHKRLIGRR
jgi:hypothetical protein